MRTSTCTGLAFTISLQIPSNDLPLVPVGSKKEGASQQTCMHSAQLELDDCSYRFEPATPDELLLTRHPATYMNFLYTAQDWRAAILMISLSCALAAILIAAIIPALAKVLSQSVPLKGSSMQAKAE
jgi:hypothetical protein